jgi:hypothetical protein
VRSFTVSFAAAAIVAAAFVAACDHSDPVEETAADAAPPAAPISFVPGAGAAPVTPGPDAGAPRAAAPTIIDGGIRGSVNLLAMADAGRFCGAPDQPPCPLQEWMKEHATPMLKFAEISALAEVFDQIALLAPPRTGEGRYPFPNWVSIARDGASAVRAGEIEASKAACRGCHVQYRATYHQSYRGLLVPADLPGSQK